MMVRAMEADAEQAPAQPELIAGLCASSALPHEAPLEHAQPPAAPEEPAGTDEDAPIPMHGIAAETIMPRVWPHST